MSLLEDVRGAIIQPMKTSRRKFLANATLGLGALGILRADLLAAESPKPPSFLTGQSRMKLGTVTYNLAKDWDIETIIKNCTDAQFEGVELRTTHAHGVEASLSKQQRAEVKKRFAGSPVRLWSLGSAFDYHTPDPNKLRKDIEATKEYILLAHDVGATGVKVRPNGLPKDIPIEKTLEQIGKSLQELGKFGADYNQQIRLEVHGPGTSHLPHIRRIMDVAGHPLVGVCWNCNQDDLDGDGFDANFDLVKHKIFTVHMRDLFLEEYPFRKLLARLNEIHFTGFTFAEIPESADPLRVMRYLRALWLSYQGLL
jgi:sugar phosphate isomerase/epimerase